MLHIIVSDITSLNEKLTACYLPSNAYINRILNNTGNKKERLLRIGAYLTLKEAYEIIFDYPMPNISRDENGKPHFDEINNDKDLPRVSFSISHTDTLVAIAFSDIKSARIGVDIEKKTYHYKSEKINERLLKNVNFNLLNPIKEPIKIAFGKILANGKFSGFYDAPMLLSNFDICDNITERVDFSVSETDIKQNDCFDFFARWTLLESALKADGRGFGGISEINNIFSSSRSVSYSVYKSQEEYSLSLTVI